MSGTAVDSQSAERLQRQTSFNWPFGKTQVISKRQESRSASFPSKSNTVGPLLSTANKWPAYRATRHTSWEKKQIQRRRA